MLTSDPLQIKGGQKMNDMKMTEEEAKKIEECMDKPEFMGLFRDYVKDISDPANMEEYDQYIRQLEEEGEIPEDEEVVRPEKGFCIKTKTVDVQGKIFVNCCGTDVCPPPTQRPGTAPREEGSTGNPGTGAHWSLPYIYTSCRMDQDNKKEPCHVYDILFNTEALRLAEKVGLATLPRMPGPEILKKTIIENPHNADATLPPTTTLPCIPGRAVQGAGDADGAGEPRGGW